MESAQNLWGSCNQNVGVPPMMVWCLAGTVHVMAMTLRLTEDEQDALRRRAALGGTSMQDVARRAVREYVARAEHRDRVASAAEHVVQRHAVALKRLGD